MSQQPTPSLLNLSLPTALPALRQIVIPPPAPSTTTLPPPPTSTPTLTLSNQTGTSNNKNVVLALIPTANAAKSALLRTHLDQTKPPHITLHFATVPADSGVGEQPYDGAGVRGAYNRVVNAAVQALGKGGVVERLREVGGELEGVEFGTVLVGAVENFIARPPWDEQGPVDYGVVAFARVGVDDDVSQGDGGGWVWRTGVSAGVTVPVEYWREAEGCGFEDKEKTHGKVTVGEVLAANVKGLDKADWHLELAGRSRYELLREAMVEVEVPWPGVETGESK